MSYDRMRVTFSAIQTAVSDTNTIAGSIDQQLDDLKSYLAPLVASWTGEASTQYQALQRQWDTSAANLNQVLREISTTLSTAHQNYTDAEQANTAIWAS